MKPYNCDTKKPELYKKNMFVFRMAISIIFNIGVLSSISLFIHERLLFVAHALAYSLCDFDFVFRIIPEQTNKTTILRFSY